MKYGFAIALATAANAASDWTSRPGLPDFAKGFQSPSRYVSSKMDYDHHDDHHDDHDDHHSPSGFGSGKWNSYSSSSRRPSYQKEEPKPSYSRSYSQSSYRKEEPKQQQHSYGYQAKVEAPRPLYNEPKYNYDSDRYNGYSQHQAPSHEHKPSHQHYEAPKQQYQAPKPQYQAPKPYQAAPQQHMGYQVNQRQNSYQNGTGQQNMGIQSQHGHGYAAPQQPMHAPQQPMHAPPQQHGYAPQQPMHAPPQQHGHHQNDYNQHADGAMFYNSLDQLERELAVHMTALGVLRAALVAKEAQAF